MKQFAHTKYIKFLAMYSINISWLTNEKMYNQDSHY